MESSLKGTLRKEQGNQATAVPERLLGACSLEDLHVSSLCHDLRESFHVLAYFVLHVSQ
jgi:hypothetical protein